MALDDVLARIPGLAGYRAQQQFDDRRNQSALGQLLGVVNMVEQQKQRGLQQEMLRAQIDQKNREMQEAVAMRELLTKYVGGAGGPAGPTSEGPQPLQRLNPFATLIAGSKMPNAATVGRMIQGATDPGKITWVDVGDKKIAYYENGQRAEHIPPQSVNIGPAEAARLAQSAAQFGATEARQRAEFADKTGVVLPAPAAVAPMSGGRPLTEAGMRSDMQVNPPTAPLPGSPVAALQDELVRARARNDTREAATIETELQRLQAQAPQPQAQAPQPQAPASVLSPSDKRAVEREATQAGYREAFQSISKRYETLADAPNQIAMLNKARSLIGESAPFVGPFGETKSNIVSFFNNNFGTNIAPDKIANAGALRTAIFTQIMDNLKKMDAQPSQLQQKMMMDALGNLSTDPGAMKAITDIMDEVVRTKVDAHNKRIPPRLPNGELFKIEIPQRIPAPTQLRPGEVSGNIRQGGEIKFLGFD